MVESSWADWISASTNLVMALGVIYAWFQFELYRKEKSFQVLLEFLTKSGGEVAAARKLVVELGDKESGYELLELLENREPFVLPGRLKPLLHAAIPQSTRSRINWDDTTAPETLNLREVFSLRTSVIWYLNAVELVFLSAAEGFCSKDIVYRELHGFYMPTEKKTFMLKYRIVAEGEESWPYLHAYLRTHAAAFEEEEEKKRYAKWKEKRNASRPASSP